MYRIAVVIPTLNEGAFIQRCIDSVINQSFPFSEMDVMVVDGGSVDNTKELVKSYCRKYTNIRLLENPLRIQSAAFNLGVENSAAPFVARLDAHAEYDRYYIEKCLDVYCSGNDVMGHSPSLIGNVGGRCIIEPPHKGLVAESAAILNKSRFGIGGASFRVGTHAGFVDTVPFGCFPRCVIGQIGGMREDLPRGEDNEYNSRIRKSGYKIYFDPQIVCRYYSRDTLKKNLSQMCANGKSIGRLFYIDRTAVGIRHLVPFIFVGSIVLGAILSFINKFFLVLFLSGLATYFVCDLCASIVAAKNYGWRFLFPLFFLFFAVHISYGCGTIVGLFRE